MHKRKAKQSGFFVLLILFWRVHAQKEGETIWVFCFVNFVLKSACTKGRRNNLGFLFCRVHAQKEGETIWVFCFVNFVLKSACTKGRRERVGDAEHQGQRAREGRVRADGVGAGARRTPPVPRRRPRRGPRRQLHGSHGGVSHPLGQRHMWRFVGYWTLCFKYTHRDTQKHSKNTQYTHIRYTQEHTLKKTIHTCIKKKPTQPHTRI